MLAPALLVVSLGSGRTPTELCLKSISRAHVKGLPKGAKDLKEGGKVTRVRSLAEAFEDLASGLWICS